MKSHRPLMFAGLLMLAAAVSCGSEVEPQLRYVASATQEAEYFIQDDNKELVPAGTIVRGTAVEVVPSKVDGFQLFKQGKDSFLIPEESLAQEYDQTVLESKIFVRTPVSVICDTVSSQIITLADKGAELQVLGFDKMDNEGRVRRYHVKTQRGREGYVYGNYTVLTPEEAAERYNPVYYDSLLATVRNPFKGGDAKGCDFYPRERKNWGGKVMPEKTYGFYMTISPIGLKNIESYIQAAKGTKINTFVIDIKDDGCPGYRADAMKKHSPTNYSHTGEQKIDLYTNAVKRLHEEGYWVVGRITCFKDQFLVNDHPEYAIVEKATGKPLFHNKSYWPSAFDRRVWQFNVELAKESVQRFGFDEINFDYVRFPDRMVSMEDQIDFHNIYHESKVQAIQRFVQYAADEVHAVGAYVSVDVFGECASPRLVTAYGQYWPAISGAVDAICGMPYPDHLPNFYAGIERPWNHPYEAMLAWGKNAARRQAETSSPAKVRTWLQAYHVMRHVDKEGIDYNAENIAKEIKGLQDAGVCDGYVTWLASANLERYKEIAPAFK